MTKRQKIDQLIEEHKCQVSLRVHSPEMLLASYSYDWDADTSFRFTLFSEVAASLQDAFDAILKRRGLLPCGSLEGNDRPFVQDLLTPDHTSPAGRRWAQLMPDMAPRWVRAYDNGGRDAGGSIDQYTVVFTGRAAADKPQGCPNQWPYLAMNAAPFHPQGFGQHGHSNHQPCDVNKQGWAPAVGRKNHLGTRINFADLPDDCRRLVIGNYMEIWKL